MSSAADATVTRYLCAGAYLDPDFARSVIDELAADPSRGVAPAPGIDVPAVVRHALAAVRHTIRRDAALTAILVLAAVATGLRGVLIVAWLSSLVLLVWATRHLVHGQAGRALAQVLAFLAFSAVFLVTLLVIHVQSHREYARPVGWSGWLPFDLGTVALVVVLLWIVTFLARIGQFAALGEQLAHGRFDPGDAPAEAAHERGRLAYLAQAQGSALAVYSVRAPDAPFVGLGPVVHAWSAATRLAPRPESGAESGAASGPAVGPDVADLYQELRPALVALAAQWGRGEVVDLVVAPGSLPPGHPFLVGAPPHPLPQVPAALVAELATHPGQLETYYQAVFLDTQDGRGGLVGLVHLGIGGESLSVDVAVTALPPVNPRFRDVDEQSAAGAAVLVATLAAALADVFRLSYRAPGSLARSVSRSVLRRAALTAKPGSTPVRPDVGARWGLRELAADAGQETGPGFEVTRGVNLVGRTVADAIAGVLVGHGLDAEEFTRSADQVRAMALVAGPSGPAVRPGSRPAGPPLGRERS